MTKTERAVVAKLKESGLTIYSEWSQIVDCLGQTNEPRRCILTAKNLQTKSMLKK